MREFLCPAAEAWGLSIPDAAMERLELYAARLAEMNKVMNLTAVDDPQGIAIRHFLDSLRPMKTLKQGACLADVGTGAGFPGLPLAIVREDMQVLLSDSLGKRVDFLDRLLEELQLGERVKTLWIRAEDLGQRPEYRAKFDYAAARAVAPLNVLSEYLLPLVKMGGSALAWKGSSWQEEVHNAGLALERLGGGSPAADIYRLPGGEYDLAVISVKKIRPTPAPYPRKAGKPGKNPL